MRRGYPARMTEEHLKPAAEMDQEIAELGKEIADAKTAAEGIAAPDTDPFPESQPPRDEPGTPY